jgi:hypothetical protein
LHPAARVWNNILDGKQSVENLGSFIAFEAQHAKKSKLVSLKHWTGLLAARQSTQHMLINAASNVAPKGGVRTMKTKMWGMAISLLAVSSVTYASAITELYFSEYIEGSSNNKALEIHNGTGESINLSDGGYNVQMFFNGNTSAGLTVNLAGTVASGDVFVIAQSSANATLLTQADQTNGAGWFNGDDAVVLRQGTTVIDVIGQVGFDPGSEWGSGSTSTANNTLRRKGTIGSGDADGSDAFDPAIEWNGYSQDTFDGLGSHTSSVPAGDLVINEFVANHTGGDDHEFVEIFGEPGTDYSTYALLQIEGDGSNAGVIDTVYQLGTMDSSGYWTTGFLTSELENGSMTLLLVQAFFDAAVGDDLDADNDGVLDSTPWGRIVDAIAVSDGDAGDHVYSSVILAGGFDGNGFTPGGASRIPNGADTDTIADWVRNDFDGAGLPGFVGSLSVGEALNTPGAINSLSETVPEPTTLTLLGLGLAGFSYGRRKQIKAA